MIPKIKKILYATDLSSGADHALGYALSIAMSGDARISIINVYEKMSHNKNIEMRSEDFASAKQKLTARIKKNLLSYTKAEVGDECAFTKYVENIYVTAGVPVDTIIEQAKDGDYDLIIMGTHGHGFLYSALIGSTAKRMIAQSPIPVLVARIPDKLN
ncbi:MAG: universal stress protein [Desulfuromusa sp.]|nr:universal stress protein [Desulfuromusa sp.]